MDVLNFSYVLLPKTPKPLKLMLNVNSNHILK